MSLSLSFSSVPVVVALGVASSVSPGLSLSLLSFVLLLDLVRSYNNVSKASDAAASKVGALVGQVMKKTRGTANPGEVNGILDELLEG